MVQWLRPHTPNAGGTGSIPGQGTKIPHAPQCSQKIKQSQKYHHSPIQKKIGGFLISSDIICFTFPLLLYACFLFKSNLHQYHLQFTVSTDRFGMLPLDEPTVLVSEFLDRFQSLCHLDLQLPSLRPEDLKTMVSFSWLAYSGLQLSPACSISFNDQRMKIAKKRTACLSLN